MKKKLIEDIEEEFAGVCVYDVSPTRAIADFVEIVDRQPKLAADTNVGSKWIPCSERLPDTKTKPYQSVLLQVGNSIVVGYVNSAGQWFVDTGDGWSADLDGEPVAWQPLPEPYKGE